MIQAEATEVREDVIEFPPELVSRWRLQMEEQREMLFRRNWKNPRQIVLLKSREDEENYQFVLEWVDEFEDVVGRQKERDRLDSLIARGLDVNAPENRPK
jgi:hypothetical protein